MWLWVVGMRLEWKETRYQVPAVVTRLSVSVLTVW